MLTEKLPRMLSERPAEAGICWKTAGKIQVGGPACVFPTCFPTYHDLRGPLRQPFRLLFRQPFPCMCLTFYRIPHNNLVRLPLLYKKQNPKP